MRVSECVCVCEREREREREMAVDIVSVTVSMSVCFLCACVYRFQRNSRKQGWPDTSHGSKGTITRLVRVPGYVPWHYSTHEAIGNGMRELREAVDSSHSAGTHSGKCSV